MVAPAAVARVFALMGLRGTGRPRLNHFDWLMSLVYHALAGAETFAHHVLMLTGVSISDTALSLRKASFGWELLAILLLAAAVLAGQRLGVAGQAGVPALKISLAQVMERSRALTEILEAGRGLSGGPNMANRYEPLMALR